MKVYWRLTRRGQRLVLASDDGEHEEEIGGVRETKRGFDAFAKTFGYDPAGPRRGSAAWTRPRSSSSSSVRGSCTRAATA